MLIKIISSINYLVWLGLCGVVFAIGEYLSKKFALEPKVRTFIYIVLVYNIGTLTWLPAIVQRNQLAIVGTIWSAVALLTTIFIGVLIFGEKVSLFGVIGILLAFTSIIFLAMS